MLLIHARSYAQALNYARGKKLTYPSWNYVTAGNLRGLRGMEMVVLPEAEKHEDHVEIMIHAREQDFKVRNER